MIHVGPLAEDRYSEAAALIDADRVLGQPRCTAERVARVARGQARADVGFWGQLARIEVRGAFDAVGRLVGCGSVGESARGTRYLMWLHGREDAQVVAALLHDLVPAVEGNLFAFWFATDLTAGFEGLPAATRPVTHRAMVGAGLVDHNAWLYLHTDRPGRPPDGSCTVRVEDGDGGVRSYVASVDGVDVATAEGSIDDGTGVMWWIEVNRARRRRGVGRTLLRTVRRDLWDAGARCVVLYVDHDDPVERDRRPALALYAAEGFEIVDRPMVYRSPGAVEESGEDAG